MVPYILLMIIPIVYYMAAYYGNHNIEKSKRTAIYIFFIILFFLLSFRNTLVGTDLSNYQYRFYLAKNTTWYNIITSPDIEKGYTILNKIIIVLGGNFRSVLIFSSFVICTAGAYFYKLTENPILTIVLFMSSELFGSCFSGLRQALAMAITMFAYGFLKEKKTIPYLLMTVLAMQFHLTAILMIFSYIAYWFKFKKKYLYWIVPLMAIIFIYRGKIYDTVMKYMPTKYIERYTGNFENGAIRSSLLYMIFLIFVFATTYKKEMDPELKGLRNILFILTVVGMFMGVSNTMVRVANYFYIFVPLVIPKAVNESNIKYKQVSMVASKVISVFFMFYFYYNALFGRDLENIFPYISMWE